MYCEVFITKLGGVVDLVWEIEDCLLFVERAAENEPDAASSSSTPHRWWSSLNLSFARRRFSANEGWIVVTPEANVLSLNSTKVLFIS